MYFITSSLGLIILFLLWLSSNKKWFESIKIEYIATAKYNTAHLRNTVKVRNGRATVRILKCIQVRYEDHGLQ